MTERQAHLHSAGINMAVEAVTREAVEALRRDGISCLVLKGPALSKWLDDRLRTSEDADVLVAAADGQRARQALRGLGYRQLLPGDRTTIHATTWRREGNAIALDLHVTVVGAGCDPETLWTTLEASAETESIGGVQARVPAVPARLLLLALHGAQHGSGEPSTLRDLNASLRLAEDGEWPKALELARRIDAVDAFAAGLRLVPDGAELADLLGLPVTTTSAVALRAATPPHTALGVAQLIETRGVGARLKIVVDELIPSPAFMRDWTPVARRGRLGLALAYAYRPFWLVRWSISGVRAWWHARRSSGRSRG